MGTPELHDFFAALRSGDTLASRKAVDQISPILCQIIHLRLLDGRLSHILETADIFQSLLRDFLARQNPPDDVYPGLQAYLAAAVLNKIITKLRKERRHAGGTPDGWEPITVEPPVGSQLEMRDTLQAIRRLLSGEERKLSSASAPAKANGLRTDV